MGKGSGALLSVAALLCGFLCLPLVVEAQVTIPARSDGFVYGDGAPARRETVVVEAFFDPLCPDSRDAWPHLKRAIKHYSPHVSLIVHPFALPYHDNAFVASRALHIADRLNSSSTYHLLELFFKHQERYYNKATREHTRASTVRRISELAAKAAGHSPSAFASGFDDGETDMATRTSFKYACSRGVTGTPLFFVNGFALPDGGSAVSYAKWRSVIGPLLKKTST